MSNEEQIAYWNGDAGRKWAEKDDMMSAVLRPIAEDLLHHAELGGCHRVIDVGCGGGSDTLLLADALDPGAEILGVDISEPLLKVARARLADMPGTGKKIDFVKADAATYSFEKGWFDGLFSRFGVMFFDDPGAAFGNLHRALQPASPIAFSCWQKLQQNPWVAVPLAAALRHVPPPERPDPEAPGPFAFAKPERVRGILRDAGFIDTRLKAHAVEMRWSAEQDLESAAREVVNIGPVGRLLADVDEGAREAVYADCTEALAPYYRDQRLSLPGAVWLVTARAGNRR